MVLRLRDRKLSVILVMIGVLAVLCAAADGVPRIYPYQNGETDMSTPPLQFRFVLQTLVEFPTLDSYIGYPQCRIYAQQYSPIANTWEIVDSKPAIAQGVILNLTQSPLLNLARFVLKCPERFTSDIFHTKMDPQIPIYNITLVTTPKPICLLQPSSWELPRVCLIPFKQMIIDNITMIRYYPWSGGDLLQCPISDDVPFRISLSRYSCRFGNKLFEKLWNGYSTPKSATRWFLFLTCLSLGHLCYIAYWLLGNSNHPKIEGQSFV